MTWVYSMSSMEPNKIKRQRILTMNPLIYSGIEDKWLIPIYRCRKTHHVGRKTHPVGHKTQCVGRKTQRVGHKTQRVGRKTTCWPQNTTCWPQNTTCWPQNTTCWPQNTTCWRQNTTCWHSKCPNNLSNFYHSHGKLCQLQGEFGKSEVLITKSTVPSGN